MCVMLCGVTRIANFQSTKPLLDIFRHIYCLTNASSRNGLQTADETFEDGIKNKATNPGNFVDASIHHNKKTVVESHWDAYKTTENIIIEDVFINGLDKEVTYPVDDGDDEKIGKTVDIEDDFTDGMNMEVIDPVDDAAKYDMLGRFVKMMRQ